MTNSQTLPHAQSALNTHKNTLLESAWEFMGLELKQALEAIPDDSSLSEDREAAQTAVTNWEDWRTGWKSLRHEDQIQDPSQLNLLRMLNELVAA